MIGSSLSQYKITAEIGRGGMGIVYRATDTKLDREVAIKVLPPSALANEDDRARFYREAKAAAQLHHPHIASIFQIDESVPDGGSNEEPRPFIAMELVDGQPLDVRAKEGPMKLSEAVRIVTQIASALEMAHEKNIVHRDIKSANVMLTAKGEAKVLDFGLAQTAHSTKLTRMGSTLGTIAYMSPEQARGEEVDRRTDLWSLGVVLYELVSGQMPFASEYEQAAVYGILNEDPEPLTAIRTGVPMGLEWIVSKLLAKNANERYQNAGDLLVDLKTVDLSSSGLSRASVTTRIDNSVTAGVPPTTVDGKATGLGGMTPAVWALAGAVVVGMLWAFWPVSASGPAGSMKRLQHNIQTDGAIIGTDISPDGSKVAIASEYVSVFDLETGRVERMPQSSTAIFVDFSPDGQSLLMTTATGISRMSLESGAVVEILVSSEGGPRASWIDNERFLYEDGQSVYTSSITSGVGRQVVQTDSVSGEYDLDYPVILDDGKTVMATAEYRDAPSRIGFWDLDSGENRGYLDIPGYRAQLFGDTHIVFVVEETLMLMPFDQSSRSQTGPVVSLADEVRPEGVSVSGEHTLIHAGNEIGIRDFTGPVNVGLIEKKGTSANFTVLTGIQSDRYRDLRISPDGNEAVGVVETVLENGGLATDLWIMDFETQVRRRLTNDGISDYPDWSASGDSVIYVRRAENDDIRIRAASGRGDRRLYLSAIPVVADIEVSPDGNTLAFTGTFLNMLDTQSAISVWDGVDNKAVTFGTGNPRYPAFSPNGEWLAYSDNGRILVQSMLDLDTAPSVVWERSMTRPRWSADGGVLYVVSPAGGLEEITVESGDNFRVLGTGQNALNLISSGTGFFDVFDKPGMFLMPTAASDDAIPASDRPDSSMTSHVIQFIVNLSSGNE